MYSHLPRTPPVSNYLAFQTLAQWTGARVVATEVLQRHASWLHSLKDKIDLELNKSDKYHPSSTRTYPYPGFR
jgi:hypothetical protein